MDKTSLDYWATPTLIRAARGAYAGAIRAALHAVGIDDLPRNGAFVLTGISRSDQPRPDLPGDLGITKQAVSQVIDTLVSRGYLTRSPDPDDRRRIALELTERGRQVVDLVVHAVGEVDRQLSERVPAEQVEAMRSALLALAEIKTTSHAAGTALRPPVKQLRQFSPILPVRDLGAALAHYTALGFETLRYEGGDDYGFANRDGIGVHLACDHGHDHGHDDRHDHAHGSGLVYLYVRDADALYLEWTGPGIGGRTTPVHPTPYGLREGSHLDLDGNLIRFGSPMAEETQARRGDVT